MNRVSKPIKINFDAVGKPEEPTLILAKRNGDKLGKIFAHAIEHSGNMNAADEITFNVYKYIDGKLDPMWDKISNFKLLYYVEADRYFEITVETDESNETVKTCFAVELGQAELSQLNLYNIEINTEADIERDDYVIPTVLYRENGILGEGITESDVKFYKEVKKEDMKHPFPDYEEASLLHRILKDKAPHYSIAHVDSNLQHMQREFTFDGTSIYDACQEIAEELNCLFVFDSYSDNKGNIQRTISVYDLESNCKSCGHRDEFSDVCPECGNTNIDDGYGEDTTIFVTADEIADDIQLTTDTEAMKNCFKLEAGDDLMTATIRNCNPNGSDYIWYLSDAMKADMSEELVNAIEEYNKVYEKYQSQDIYLEIVPNVGTEFEEVDELPRNGNAGDVYIYNDSVYVWVEGAWYKNGLVDKYNELVDKYNNFMKIEDDDKFEKIENPVKGFPALINAYYNMFDMYLYLESGLMPTVNTARPSKEEEINKLKESMVNGDGITVSKNLSPVAVNVTSTSSNPLKAASVQTADNLVLSMAKTLIDPRYKVKVLDNSVLGYYVDGEFIEDTPENRSKYVYVDGTSKYWHGNFHIEAVSDDKTECDTNDGEAEGYYIEIEINDDYEAYVKNKLDKTLSEEDIDDLSISSLFKKELAVNFTTPEGAYLKDNEGRNLVGGSKIENSFQYALKEYSLKRLESFHDACQSCVELLVEQGVSNRETWGDKRICNSCKENEVTSTKIKSSCPNPDCDYDKDFIMSCPECGHVGDSINTCEACNSSDIDYGLDLYTMLYADYAKKLGAIQEEMNVRSNEMAIIYGVRDKDGNVIEDGLQTIIEKIKANIQGNLDFEKFLCEFAPDNKLWYEFCSFRREDKYSNDNYISEGKNNAEIITLANEFIETAKKEIYKSAELQCSISASLKNLLVIEKFKPLVNNFRVGNWLRVMVDDKVYKLRLISYTIDYDSLDSISVEFSDVVRANSSIKSVKDVLAQASSMATSYPAVQRQAKQGEESNAVVSSWFDSGLDATNVKIVGGADGQCQTWDNHGMLFREYDDATGDYSPEQMKIINSTMAITTDNWKTTKTAVGKYYYNDPRDENKLKMAYGVNAETIVGKFILGENMMIQNESGNMTFDGDGLSITSGTDDNAGTMTFDENGLVVKHGQNTVTISPKDKEVMNITHKKKDGTIEKVFNVGEDGELTVDGSIMARSLKLGNGVTIDSDIIKVTLEDGTTTGLATVAVTGEYNALVGDSDKAGQVLSLNSSNGVEAISLSYKNLADYSDLALADDIPDVSDKFNIPTNDGTATAGQYLRKTSSGSSWASAATSISSSGTAPVSGSAVYNYAVANNWGEDFGGRLLFVDYDGIVKTLTIDSLKNLLGLT